MPKRAANGLRSENRAPPRPCARRAAMPGYSTWGRVLHVHGFRGRLRSRSSPGPPRWAAPLSAAGQGVESQSGLCTNLSRRTRWCVRQGRPGWRPPALDTGSRQLTGRRGLLGQGGRGGPETSQPFPSQDRRPAAKAGLIAARLFLCRPASVPRILRWRMHENIPTVPYQSPPGTLSCADCGFQKQHGCILVCQVTPRTA